MTLLIGSIFAERVEPLAAWTNRAWNAGAQALELRIDRLEDPPERLAAFLQKFPERTWILTCKSRHEGGFFEGTPAQAAGRVARSAKDTFAWMDIGLSDWRAHHEVRSRIAPFFAGTGARRLILSTHILHPNVAQQLRPLMVEALQEGPHVVAKVACSADSILDSFEALDLMHEFGPRVVAICMGEAGAWTRVLAKKLGSFAAYASIPGFAATAPGQWTIAELRDDFHWDALGRATRVYGVVGDPVAHSLSPRLFRHWFRDAAADAVYFPLHMKRNILLKFLDECRARPWLDVAGLSVTIPHKREALAWAGEGADPMSRGIGAANTLALGGRKVLAYNTDCYAAVESLARALGTGRNALCGFRFDLLGSGGTARAVCYGLREFGCQVSVFGRSREDQSYFQELGATFADWADRVASRGDVLVNCTPVGMWPRVEESPMPANALDGRKLVFDIVYRPLKTRLLREAAHAGCRTLNGLDMFVRQAATQFELWTGSAPDSTSAAQRLRAFLESEESRHPRDLHRTQLRSGVALIGARGSGKTTIGRILARRLAFPHIDTDEMVVARGGQPIDEIFRRHGEAGFRKLEQEVVHLATAGGPVVISLGGGAVLDPGNVAAIRGVARTVWLTAPEQVLRGRISSDPAGASGRPALTPKGALEEIGDVLRQREALYRAAADFVLDTADLGPEESAMRILDWLSRH